VLVIRRAQMELLERASLEGCLLSHLRANFPQFCESLPGRRQADFVAQGVARARTHGFTETSHLAQWLNLMVLLGPRFDEDPGCSWVTGILGESESESTKMQDLLDAAEDHVWEGDES